MKMQTCVNCFLNMTRQRLCTCLWIEAFKETVRGKAGDFLSKMRQSQDYILGISITNITCSNLGWVCWKRAETDHQLEGTSFLSLWNDSYAVTLIIFIQSQCPNSKSLILNFQTGYVLWISVKKKGTHLRTHCKARVEHN